MILVYHRVAEANVDPWALGVSPGHFAQQLQALRAIASPISLQELVNAKSDRDLPPRPVCVTFDDGYADNLYAAKPALEAYQVPATVFITPGYLDVAENLWWDELAKLILDPKTRQEEVSFSLNGQHYAYVFPPSAEDRADGDPNAKWRAWEAVPGPRQSAYLAVYEMLVKLPDLKREEAMEQLRRGATYPDRQQHRCLTEDELRELASGELVEIGAHTLTHPVLSQLPPDQQQHEIGGSRRRLEALIGRNITSFAYPYGKKMHYTSETVKTVKANGFSCACSNFGGLVTRISDRFTLPRFQPMDWDGDRFADVVENGWYRD
ncbi:MAG TPA: polysaccharide deacetylase family protein [Acidobacteriaceae bacterium]|nr:polysaccharide deacetylase family protein [Acidobacteriaceae bacterium]